jgi:outer membrane protein OmpA-like peptidoglycan-associated protein
MNMHKISLPLAAAVLAVLGACASTPPRNAALDAARASYDSARADPQVAALAVDELAQAGTAVETAGRALADRQPPATVDHLAYMAAQHVVVAQATASSRAAQAVTASAGAERDKLRLDVRTAEADAATRRLAASEESAVQAERDLAAAEATARREREEGGARVAALESQLAELNARETERGLVVTLGDVLFDTGKALLLPGGSRNVAKLAEFLVQNPERTASIEGHTDDVGSAAANYELSERRANAVLGALVGAGVSRGNLSTRALGADMPTASNDSTAGRQMNRRVEIVIAKSTPVAAAR